MLPRDRVEQDMRRRLLAGEWAPGEALPAVAALAARYETSGATVSKALRRLADAGLIVIIPSWGSFRAGDAPGNDAGE